MFINRMDNRRQAPVGAGAGKPIRMFLYVNEAEAEENDSGIDNTTAEEDPDQINDKVTFEVTYGGKVWLPIIREWKIAKV